MVDRVKEKIEDGVAQELNKVLLFEERNRLYLLFFFYISALKLVSSFFYMGICANRHKPLDDMKVTYYALIFFEFCFLIEIILQFFRKVTPDGASKPLCSFADIAKHYIRTKFVWHFIPILPLQYI